MIHPTRLLYLSIGATWFLLAACSQNQSVPEIAETNGEDGRETQHCIMIYQPVCALASAASRGSQGVVYKTFSNSCFAAIERAQVTFEGECGKLEGKTESGR